MIQTTVSDVVSALNAITGGRVPTRLSDLFSGKNPFVVVKSSSIPGKSITEIPGLVFGDPKQSIKKLAVIMTLTESNIELAGALGVDAIVAHHPVADAASSGGVTLKSYLSLYKIAVFELHEAFHGLHPGLSYLHGHVVFRTEIAYAGMSGNIMFVGRTIKGVNTLGDMLDRIHGFMGFSEEQEILKLERNVRGCDRINETMVSLEGKILVGSRESKANTVLHIFPHTGFTLENLEQALREHPEIDTVLATISRVKEGNPLVEKCRSLGLNFIVGNSHALEIFENGLPLAAALQKLLPEVEVMVFRERVTAVPLKDFGSLRIGPINKLCNGHIKSAAAIPTYFDIRSA